MEHLYRKIQYTRSVYVDVEIPHYPREGHLVRVRRIYGYLRRFRHFKIRFQVDEPDYSNTPPIQDHGWEHSVYGKHEEDIAEDLPEPLIKQIVLTHYFDASLMHDILSEKAVTGV